MRLKEEQAAELRLWAAGKLELLTETDPNILADYAVELLNGDTHIEDVRNSVVSALEDILLENTAQFVAELFVRATSHLRPPMSVPSAPAAFRRVTRNPLPISRARSALSSAAPLSSAPPGSRKRNYAQAYGNDDQPHHIGSQRVTKRGRGSGGFGDGILRANWRGKGQDTPALTGTNIQAAGLGFGHTPFNLLKPPTPPPGMSDFMAMFPYMAAMASAQGMIAKRERCEYFDVHGYCMRGDACSYEHTKQTPDVEARHETEGYASDTEPTGGMSRKKAQCTRRLPSTAGTPVARKLFLSLSNSANDPSPTPEEPDEPKTPAEAEFDIEAFKAEQTIKQQDHDIRLARLKENQSRKAILAQKTAEIEAKLAAEKAKLMAKPGGDKILALISAEQRKKVASVKTGTADLARTAIDIGIDPDVVSVGGTPDSRPRRGLSTPSDAGGYKGKNQAICRFFPNCTNPACTFKHTADSSAFVVLCKFFPNCTNSACTFKHASKSQTSDVLCRFFPNCAKSDCTFKHPDGRPTSNVQCKFHPNCTNTACAFKHGDGGMSEIDCKYCPDCTNPRCGFKHPEGSTRPGAVKRVDNQPKNLLISGVSVGFNNGVDSMNMVRVAVMGISACESIQPQSFHDPANSADDAHDGLVVTFAERWQAEEVRKRLTMVGGVGKVKCAWYMGPLGAKVMGTPRTELEVDTVYGGDSDEDGDMKMGMDDVRIKDEDLDVAGEDDWAQIS